MELHEKRELSNKKIENRFTQSKVMTLQTFPPFLKSVKNIYCKNQARSQQKLDLNLRKNLSFMPEV